MLWFNLLLLFTVAISSGDSYKILTLFHIPIKSHHILASKLVKELARKGHEVTFVTPFPEKTQEKNVKEISLEGLQALFPRK